MQAIEHQEVDLELGNDEKVVPISANLRASFVSTFRREAPISKVVRGETCRYQYKFVRRRRARPEVALLGARTARPHTSQSEVWSLDKKIKQ